MRNSDYALAEGLRDDDYAEAEDARDVLYESREKLMMKSLLPTLIKSPHYRGLLVMLITEMMSTALKSTWRTKHSRVSRAQQG